MYDFRPSPIDPRLEVAEVALPWERIEDEAARMRVAPDQYAFCGLHDRFDGAHRLYRASGVPPAELAGLFSVGSHDDAGGERVERVRAELEAVHALAPLVPTFVDAAGFGARFRDPVPPELALRVAALLTEGLEGYEMEDDFGEACIGDGDDPAGFYAAFLHRDQALRLFFD